MSVGLFTFGPRLWRKLSPSVVSFQIVLLVFAGVLGIRHLGWLQSAELHAYDFGIRHQPRAPSADPFVLVEMTEPDIQDPTFEYPIHDQQLAELLTKLEAGQPSVIGLDIWRDIPVPKSGHGLNQLNEVLLAYTNIICIFTVKIAPPPVLKDFPDRLAFNDNYPPDVGVNSTIPKVRRAELIAEPSPGDAYDSFPLRMALLYLEHRGIDPAPDPDNPRGMILGKAHLHPFRPNDGQYIRADAHGWQLLLDFKCPETFPRFTFRQALAGEIPASALRDKIVIVGINTPSVADERVTPIRRDHRGIDVQASTTHQLLRYALDGEQPLRFFDDWIEDAWVLLWCGLGGALGFGARSPWRFGFGAVLGVTAQLGLGWAAFTYGWWIPVVAPAAGFVPAASLVISYVSAQEKRERSQLMQLFSKQVSPDIAEALWEQRDDFLAGQRPRSQKLLATVLFTDLEGFSTTSEKMEPAAVMDWLNEYMEAMAGPIMAHHGVIEKYIGDAIMAVFGVPLARNSQTEIQQDARNAVSCALAMREKMQELNARWKEQGLPRCGMRIGIHTGSLVAGSLGSADRQEYTVIGDSVNTASRLESFDKSWMDAESLATQCRILISEATFRLIENEFLTSRVGAMSLKNKNEPVTIYSVTGKSKPMKEKNHAIVA